MSSTNKSQSSVAGVDIEDTDPVVSTQSCVDRSLLTKPSSAKAKFWGDPIFLFKDWKQREARGEQGAHCVKCCSNLR